MEKPIRDNFSLSKFKTGKDGGLETHFEVKEAIGDAIYIEKHHLSSAKNMHPDLAKLMKDLRPIVARVFNLTSFLSLVESPDFKGNKKQTELARSYEKEILQNIDVRGISLSGEKDNIGVVITAVLTVMKNQKTAINCPRIKFATVNFGFEEDLEQILRDIEVEVYKFLFEDKQAQLSLFNPTDDPDYVDGKSAAAGDNDKIDSSDIDHLDSSDEEE